MKYIIVFVFLFSIFSCKKEAVLPLPAGELWVTAESGLWLREEPYPDAKKIVLIPFKENVDIYEITDKDETISGITDRWAKIKWNDKTGWVFRGFLSNEDPDTLSASKDTGMGADGHLLIGKWLLKSQDYGETSKQFNPIKEKTELILSEDHTMQFKFYNTNDEKLREVNGRWTYNPDGKKLAFEIEHPAEYKILESNNRLLKLQDILSGGNYIFTYEKQR